MSHYKKVCKVCGDIITQCRCPSPNKTVTYEICKKCMVKNPLPDTRGFTLIELMVVLVILAILAAIALPTIINGFSAEKESETSQAYRVLEAHGFTDISLGGFQWGCGCSEGEGMNKSFSAKGVNGQRISGCVCWGWAGSMSVHYQ